MALIRLSNAQLAYGTNRLLDDADFSIEPDEIVALVGRNGAGKSTLLNIISNLHDLDDGQIIRQSELKVAMLTQAIPSSEQANAYEAVLELAGPIGMAHMQYLKLLEDMDTHQDQIGKLHALIDDSEAWDMPQLISDGLQSIGIDPSGTFNGLSGGKKRMLAMVAAIAQKPDLLLLDEPTNHLDLDAIEHLRQMVRRCGASVLFITHDRAFLRAIATRVVELDRGKIYSYPGNYQRFLRSRDERLHAEDLANSHFDKRLAEEEVWIRQGIKARRTRNEGRVRALKSMRDERAARVELSKNPNFNIEQGSRSGKRVAEVENLSYSVGGRNLINNFSTTILRGDRVGIIGPNGIGKTTLLRLVLGSLELQQGEVKIGTQLEIAYFDQLRAQLNENQSVGDNVSGGSDSITINGQSRHVISYLSEFLFTPERVRSPISKLSGGERNRLLLAKLFAQAANLLVLDEPTNDLDLETLELLEQLLMSFEGTLLLVSHDREFIDNVVTSVIAFEGDGVVEEYVGGYSDWLNRRKQKKDQKPNPKTNSAVTEPSAPAAPRKKLSYKDQRALELIPAQIEALEQRQSAINELLSDGKIFSDDAAQATALSEELSAIELQLLQLLERWESLENS